MIESVGERDEDTRRGAGALKVSAARGQLPRRMGHGDRPCGPSAPAIALFPPHPSARAAGQRWSDEHGGQPA